MYQLDCWTFDGSLDDYLKTGFDYIAPPVVNANGWGEGMYVGCGGLSLRRISKFIEASSDRDKADDTPEDLFFSLHRADVLKIADVRTAAMFCTTADGKDTFEFWHKFNNEKIPMFCHKFNSNDTGEFWGKYILEDKTRKISLVSFANSGSGFSRERVKFEADEMGCFSDVSLYDEHDFDKEYWEKNKSHFLDNPRGYGYWAWKPYFIKRKLSELAEGDAVVYMDMGCTILPKNKSRLLEWVHRARYSRSGILSPCFGPYFERNWSKGDIFDFIDRNYNKDHVDLYDKAVQCGATVLVVVKNKKSVELIDRWNDIMENHFDFCTDSPSKFPNHPQFVENRHDQSVFSMLSKIYGIETIPTAKGILDKKNSPIICTRCVNDKNTWKRPVRVLYDNQIFDM